MYTDEAMEPVQSLEAGPQLFFDVGIDEDGEEDILGSVPAIASKADPGYYSLVAEHVAGTVGAPSGTVFHEIVSPHVHIDVLMVPPGWRRPWTTLVTCGAGSREMNSPEGVVDRRMELALCLPNDWPSLLPEEGSDRFIGPGAWIVSNLQYYARFPFVYDTWLGEGHTILHGDPPRMLAEGSELCCAMLARPRRIGNPDFQNLVLSDGRIINFWSVIFLSEAEMRYKLREGARALMKMLRIAEIDEMLRIDRPSVC